MKEKKYYLLFVIFIKIFALSAQEKNIAVQKFVKNPILKNSSIGFCIKDFSGKQIASYNETKSLTPASILKVVTTATALETLGSDFRYKTTLAKDKKNPDRLLVHGYGDPTLGTEHLKNKPILFLTEWTKQIKRHMDTTSVMNITIIDNYFGYDGLSQRWIREDMGNYYAAGTYGISIFDNTYKIYFNTIRKDTCAVISKIYPEINLKFTNTLALNNTGKDNGYIVGEPFSDKRILIGNIPAGKQSFSLKGDIPNPGLFLGETLAKRLNENKIKTDNIETTIDEYHKYMFSKNRPKVDEEIFYTHLSYPLKDIIRDVNVRSNNHYAEHLIRTIGRRHNENIYSSALDEGINKTNELWKSRGLDTDALFMYDGCGLAPSNAVSTEFMCDLLVYMQSKSENADVFLDSFARAGKEGTVRSLLKGTRLEGKVYVKSGSIMGVQCYAGYYIDGAKKYAFAIMVNKYNSPRNEVVKAIENLLLTSF